MGGRGIACAPEHHARALRCNMAGPFQICFLCGPGTLEPIMATSVRDAQAAVKAYKRSKPQSAKLSIYSVVVKS